MNKKSITLIAIATALLLGLLVAGCDNFFNDIAGEPYQIVYASDRSGSYELYIMNADGSGETRLTYDGNNSMPKPSPDGSQIVFFKTSTNMIYLMNIDGTGQRSLVGGSTLMSPSWSPDGTRIVYSLSETQLRIINIDGTGDTAILTGGSQVNTPNWSGKSNLIAFHALSPEREIFTIAPDGSGQQQRTSNAALDLGNPYWSPDGSKLLYSKGTLGTGPYNLYTMDLTTGIETPLDVYSYNEYHASWSPDGEKIVFQMNLVNGGNYDIYVMNADGSDPTRLTFAGYNQYPSWVP